MAVTGRGAVAGGVAAIRASAVTVAEAVDAFLSSPRAASPNTLRAYVGGIDGLAAELGPHRQLTAVPDDEIAAAVPLSLIRGIELGRWRPASAARPRSQVACDIAIHRCDISPRR